MPHVIRLRGPWEVDPGGGGLPDEVAYRRAFHRPTNLTPEDRVEVVFRGVQAVARVRLNGQELGTVVPTVEDQRFAIQQRLEPRNELTLDFSTSEAAPPAAPLPRSGRQPLPDELVNEVRLEITARSA